MTAGTGTRIGPYEVLAPLGAGAMGEVFRARDLRLKRDVAIKLLPESLALDPARRTSFEREVRVLASLNHPNIATLYAIEESPAGQVLVMELVEGVTLADRLALGAWGRAGLPMREALSLAQQVAAALDAAHEHGVVHRDLKPANIAVRPDETVKLLDFGLARTLEPAEWGLDGSPPALTLTEGVAAAIGPGTPAYMSPEQARGLRTDRRADIWAFGCVLYEMLTGRRAFDGETRSDVIAAVLERAPDWSALPADTPPLVRRLLQRCLDKELKRRLRSIGDALIDLEDAPLVGTDTQPPSFRRSRHGTGLAAGAAALAVVAFTSLWVWSRPRAETPAEPVHFTTLLPAGVSVTRGPGLGSSVAVSPDGRTVIVAGTGTDGQRLYRRPLDRLEATPLAGTERGSSPFFSWDGAWVGFFADGRLKRVPASGGAAVDIVAVPGVPAGASWGPNDRIVFAYGGDGRLHTVDAGGSHAEPLSGVESGYCPEVLPDGKTLLFEYDRWVHVFDRATGRRTRLVEGSAPRYASGHVVLSRGRTLLAAAVDPARHALKGPVVPLVEGVAGDPSPSGGTRHYAISTGGTVAYVPAPRSDALVAVQADGTERLITHGEQSIQNPQFSPGGRFVAVATARGIRDPADIWIHELQDGTSTRLTFDGGRAPVWTPDGTEVTYSRLGERGGIYAKRVDGRSEPRRLLALDAFHWLVGWTPDGRTLAYGVMEGSASSIMALSGGQSGRVVGPGSTWGGRLSSDGQWLAYYSLDSGNFEVHVTPFPAGRVRWLIADGTDPSWAPGGSEVYYRSGARLMAARIDRRAGIRVLSRRVVIEPFLPPLYDDYDVHPDGRTLVMVRPAGTTQAREVAVVVNWFSELRRLLRTP